ncbi:dynein regulatory complex subunit 5-like isoform X1 [Periplaneta americana]|uniref:dynein regulatory complex subunit 5-like isoform X1 n=1 Tax=Periplaneta americana TaxID=6978 RepID=UPI0037E9328D
MRIPHTIPRNTYWVYKPSEQALNLNGELNRHIRSEDAEWDVNLLPSLATLCLQSLVSNFHVKQVLNELPDEDRCLLLETLSTDLPLTLTVPLIEDGIYWKRSSEDRWESMNYVRDYEGSWKRLYLERHLQEYLEQLAPEDFMQTEVESLVSLCSPYVKCLNIRQLQAPRTQPPVEIEGGCECPSEVDSIDHINLEPFIKGLNNLENLHIMFGVRDCGMNFDWLLFKLSTMDCTNIGLGLDAANRLKVFRIHRSNLDNEKVSVLLRHMIENASITRLDFSHCQISDNGALAIGKLVSVHPTLKEVVLRNNAIGPIGSNGLAYALQQQGSPLDLLDLRLNHIGDTGVIDLCAALAKSRYPRELILAGCGLTEKAAIRLGQMLQQNSTLQALDVSNNHLGEIGGEAFALGLNENTTLLRLDYRMTGITDEYRSLINQALSNNIIAYKMKQRELAEAEVNKNEEWE